MKPLAIWFGIFALVFGAVAIGYHLQRDGDPDQVLVVVDSSFEMESVWRQVPDELDELDDERYSEFALATEKQLIHTWAPELRLGQVTPFAPRDFSSLTSGEFDEVDGATELVLITNAPVDETEDLDGWRIVRISP